MLRWRPRNQSIAVHNAEALRVLDLGPGFGRRSLPKPQSASDPCVGATRSVIECKRRLRGCAWPRVSLWVWVTDGSGLDTDSLGQLGPARTNMG